MKHRHDEAAHVIRRLRVHVLKPRHHGQDFAVGEKDVDGDLEPDCELGSSSVGSAFICVVSAGAFRVVELLDSGCCGHADGGEEESYGNAAVWREGDVEAGECWVNNVCVKWTEKDAEE
jgi:hypothetical protein